MSLRDAFIEAVDDAPHIVSVAEALEMFAEALEDTGVPAYVNLARELRDE